MAAWALDRKYPQAMSPEPLVQIKDNFTEMFLIMHSTKIVQTILTPPNEKEKQS